jgi:hypothetical protein
MARGSNQRNGRAARSEAVRALTGRSITDENTQGSRFETMIDGQSVARRAVRFSELSEADKQKFADRGHFTGKGITNSLNAYAAMVEAGTNKDEFTDPKSKYNYENLKAAITNQEREFSYSFDKDGRLINWSRGDGNSATTSYIPGSLRGGIDVHNHPVTESRTLGLSFSQPDINGYHNSGIGLAIVFSREGEYRLQLPPAFEKLSKGEVAAATARYKTNLNLVWVAMHKSVSEGTPQDKAYMVTARMFNEQTTKLANELGLKFQFIPNKGYEWISSGADGQVPSAPAFKTSRKLWPHEETFTPPPATTRRGFTIGKIRNVRQPKKVAPPVDAPKQEPSKPNNYYTL